MANAGKKRAAPGGSSNGAASSGKKLKLANKAKSSKSGGRAGAAASSSSKSSLASKQKSFDAGASNGDGIPKRQKGGSASKTVDANIKKKVKGKGTLKEFVQDAVGNGKDSDHDDDDESSGSDALDVQDMLAADSDDDQVGPQDEDFLQRSSFLTKLDKKELAR